MNIVGKAAEKYKYIYVIIMGIVSILELVLLIRAFFVFSYTSYRHVLYTVSYAFLLAISLPTALFLFFSKNPKYTQKWYRIILYFYIIGITIWALIISFLDMERKNMPIVFLTVAVTIASIVVVEPYFYVPIVILSSIVLIGLDSIGGFTYFVSSGEYINFFVFILMIVIVNIRHYIISLRDFRQKEILETSVLEERQRVSAISIQTIMSISNAVDAKDKYTKEHSSRVAEYSMEIATRIGWSDERVDQIFKIGLLHDIGKIGVPDSILNSTSKLTKEEFDLMKQHTIIGGEILKDLTIIKNVALGAKYHHERFDGTGYPSGLKGYDIPIEARIIAVADAFDAMNSNRVYRNRLTKEKIISELIDGKGKQFDPDLIDVFMPYALEILNKENIE